jgi:hypothetical protein
MKDFIRAVVGKLTIGTGKDDARVGLVVFSGKNTAVIFDLDTFDNNNDMDREIGKLGDWRVGTFGNKFDIPDGSTYTRGGLEKLRSTLIAESKRDALNSADRKTPKQLVMGECSAARTFPHEMHAHSCANARTHALTYPCTNAYTRANKHVDTLRTQC